MIDGYKHSGKYKDKDLDYGQTQTIMGCGQCDLIGRFFEFVGNTFSYKSRPNITVTFWAILNNTAIMKNIIWLLFGQYLEKFGNFLLHHLVTLTVAVVAVLPNISSVLS